MMQFSSLAIHAQPVASCIPIGLPCPWDKPCPSWESAPAKITVRVGYEDDPFGDPIASVVVTGKNKREALKASHRLYSWVKDVQETTKEFTFPWYLRLAIFVYVKTYMARKRLSSLILQTLCARLLLTGKGENDNGEVVDIVSDVAESGHHYSGSYQEAFLCGYPKAGKVAGEERDGVSDSAGTVVRFFD